MPYFPTAAPNSSEDIITAGSIEQTVEANCTVSPGGTALCWETMIGQVSYVVVKCDPICTV